MNNLRRFIELDVWRGLAIISMIIFHTFFLLDFLGLKDVAYHEGAWFIFGSFIRFSFLLLVGIGVYLSYQKTIISNLELKYFYKFQLQRTLLVAIAAILITLVTFALYPEQYVNFGILHLIAVSIFFMTFVASRPLLSLAISFFIYLFSFLITGISTKTSYFIIFGIMPADYSTLDYFPIFPWLALPCLGIFLGHLFYKNFQRQFYLPEEINNSRGLLIISKIGQHSLGIYMLHIPILAALIYLVKYLIIL